MFTSSFFIKYMIEVATGVAFLMTSLYGAGHANAQTNSGVIQPVIEASQITRTVNDRKAVEGIVRNKFSNSPILVEIARCESEFRQFDEKGHILRGIVNNADVGVMQINEKYHADKAKELGIDIYDIDGNLEFAKYLYKKYGTSPWVSSKPCWGQSQIAQK